MSEILKKRALNQDFFQDLLEGSLKPMLERVEKDHTLCMELRGSSVGIYYRGGMLYLIESSGDHKYSIRYNDNYRTGRDADSKKAKYIEIPSIEQAVKDIALHKEIMDFYFSKHMKFEREFQQLIVRENNNSGAVSHATDYYILDIEYAFNGNNETGEDISARYDMLAVRWLSEGPIRKDPKNLPISFIEVKYGDDAMGSGDDISVAGIHKHINDYIRFRKDTKMLNALAEDMAEVFAQKHKLGLISSYKDKPELEISIDTKDVEFLFVLANHDPAKSKLLSEIKDTLNEWKDKPEEKYLDEIRIASASFVGYGLYSFDNNKQNRYVNIKKFYEDSYMK